MDNFQKWLLNEYDQNKANQWNGDNITDKDPENVRPRDSQTLWGRLIRHVKKLNNNNLHHTSNYKSLRDNTENLIR